MSVEGREWPDAGLADRLALYDDALAAGEDPPDPLAVYGDGDGDGFDPEADRRARELADCIRLLRRTWPRRIPSTEAADGTTAGDSQRDGCPDTLTYLPGTVEDGSFELRLDPVAPIPGYEVIEEIGRGGMGIVYRARQLSLRREVALKVLTPSRAASAAALKSFRDEAATGARVRDSGVLPIHDILAVDGVPVIVMPLVEGHDLGRILTDRRDVLGGAPTAGRHPWASLPDREYLERMMPVLDQLVDAVAELHRAGVLHCDLKPSNVLVDPRGKMQVTDFGLARVDCEPLTDGPTHDLGTPGYMAPEQWERRRDIDYRADIFALGVTIYEALTLALPFGCSAVRPTAPPVPPPSRVQPLVSGAMDAVVVRATDPDRQKRYASVAEMRDDWTRARRGHRRWDRRRRWGLVDVGLGVLLVFALIVGAWNFAPGPRLPALDTAAPGRMAVLQTVAVETRPSGARVVLVPLDPRDGAPLPGKAIRPPSLSPVRVDHVPPGDYLLVAALPDGRFHEVYRHVPEHGEAAIRTDGVYSQHSWQEQSDGTVVLPAVDIPPASVTGGMASFPGTPAFAAGDARWPDLTPLTTVAMEPFYLDTHEVTVADYRKVAPALPFPMRSRSWTDLDAVRFVTWDEAAHYAEQLGKRLPTEDEYEYAATGGGARRFPWGDDDAPLLRGPWEFGPVGTPTWDRTATRPPVSGLLSNVAEWTSGRLHARGGSRRPGNDPPELADDRAVRGGSFGVVEGRPDPEVVAADGPRRRHTVDQTARHPGLGFRCARSAKPRFMVP